MKKLIVIFFILIVCCPLAIERPLHATTQSIDYLSEGKALIAQENADLATFITTYTQQKSLFSSLEQVQIESQYAGIQKTLTTTHDNLINDKGDNLKDDYNEITTLYFYEEKLPFLYSELFMFKALYLHQKLTTVSTATVTYLLSKVSHSEQIDANTQAQAIIASLSSMQTAITAIQTDYNTLASLQDTTADALHNYEKVLKDIKTQQQNILVSANKVNTSFAQLLTYE